LSIRFVIFRQLLSDESACASVVAANQAGEALVGQD
jgi:hypothetical protein